MGLLWHQFAKKLANLRKIEENFAILFVSVHRFPHILRSAIVNGFVSILCCIKQAHKFTMQSSTFIYTIYILTRWQRKMIGASHIDFRRLNMSSLHIMLSHQRHYAVGQYTCVSVHEVESIVIWWIYWGILMYWCVPVHVIRKVQTLAVCRLLALASAPIEIGFLHFRSGTAHLVWHLMGWF